jgi:hypothetical protein
MQRLGKNIGGYRGEIIDIALIVAEIQEAALQASWELDSPQATEASSLLAFHRPVTHARKRVYISSGMHGDEPAGPLAVLNARRAHGTRFAVAQDARRDDSTLATNRNPVNVGLMYLTFVASIARKALPQFAINRLSSHMMHFGPLMQWTCVGLSGRTCVNGE